VLLFDITLGLDSIEEEVVEPTRSIADPEARFLDIVPSRCWRRSNGVITLLIGSACARSQRKKINVRRRRCFEYVRETLRELEAVGRLQDVDQRLQRSA
jgi:hypothetical protein